MITTEEAATTPLVRSRMCVGGVVPQCTQCSTAHKREASNCSNNINHKGVPQQQQLHEATYIPQTPLKCRCLQELLKHHPDNHKVQYVLQGLQQGFSLEYDGPFEFRAPPNLPTAKLDPQLIRDRLSKEINLGRMLGPFKQPPFKDLMCSPVGLVPKKDSDEMRMIMHLSFPYGTSVNDFIDPEKASTQYQHFDHVIQLVVQQGQFCWIAKGDVQSAFRIAPIIFKHIKCLGIKFEGQYFVDIMLPFGSAISCAIFEDIATLVHWIFEQLTGGHFVHYLDDYLWVHKHYVVCLSMCKAVKRISQDIGLPLAPTKFMGPAQTLEFLGLTIDTVRMAVAIPQDKMSKILQELQEVLQCSKCKVKKIQSLAGRLNFITKAVPHGKLFSRKVYDLIAGMKPHWHVNITREVKRDLIMW